MNARAPNKAILIFLTALLILPLCLHSQNSSKKKKKLTWKRYHKACGKDNGDRIDNFNNFKDKTIVWHGKVAEIKYNSILQNHRIFSPKTIRIKMDPSDSLKADVKLKVPKEMEDKIDKVPKGAEILFKGKIKYLGNFTQDHVVEVEKFGKYKGKKKKKKRK